MTTVKTRLSVFGVPYHPPGASIDITPVAIASAIGRTVDPIAIGGFLKVDVTVTDTALTALVMADALNGTVTVTGAALTSLVMTDGLLWSLTTSDAALTALVMADKSRDT